MKLRRKLLSAGLALGATALTLTTSTFAWYTQNTEVQMHGVSGQSATAVGSTLLISSTSAQGSFGSSVTLTNTTTNLLPVQYTAGTAAAPTFNTFTAAGTATGDASVSGDAAEVLSFDLYFKATSATTIYLKKLEVKSTTAPTTKKKDILTYTGTPYTEGDSATVTTYSVDVQRALKMAWYSTPYTNSEAGTSTNSQARELDNLVTYQSDSMTSNAASWNAHQYYNEVAGKNITTTGAGSVTDAFTLSSSAHSSITMGVTPAGVEAGKYLKMTFYFFIDGWDLQCFDACQGQSFTVDMEFSSSADTQLTKTVTYGD